MRFQTYLGIDQKGGACSDGQAAVPLPIARFEPPARASSPSLTLGTIESLTPEALSGWWDPEQGRRTWIAIDSVFWPLQAPFSSPGLWKGFRSAARFRFVGKKFGRDVAERFFERLARERFKLGAGESAQIPRRLCEQKAGANSVFRSRPYQRNIQTGTYRVWRDLGAWDPAEQPSLWPLDPKTRKGCVIAEAYPSLLWKTVFGLPTRDRKKLVKRLYSLLPDLSCAPASEAQIEADPDLADSAVLAVGSWVLTRGAWPKTPHVPQEILQTEGWILGVE